MTFLEAVRNLVRIVGTEEPSTLKELDCILASWRANLVVSQPSSPSSPQEWDLVDGPFVNRCFGASASRPSHASESEPKSSTQKGSSSPLKSGPSEPKLPTQKECRPPLKSGAIVSLNTVAIPSLDGLFGQITNPQTYSGDVRVRLPNGALEELRVECLTVVATPILPLDLTTVTRGGKIYAVTRAPSHARFLLGIWRARWQDLQRLLLMLPPEGLKNSGFHARSFETVEAASAY